MHLDLYYAILNIDFLPHQYNKLKKFIISDYRSVYNTT